MYFMALLAKVAHSASLFLISIHYRNNNARAFHLLVPVPPSTTNDVSAGNETTTKKYLSSIGNKQVAQPLMAHFCA